MNLAQAYSLFRVFVDLAEKANADPYQFPIQFKVAIAENRKLLQPHAQTFEERRNELIKAHGEEFDVPVEGEFDPETKVQKTTKNWRLTPQSPKEKVELFNKEVDELGKIEVPTKFFMVQEKHVGSAPVTVDQIAIMVECGVFKFEQS